MFPKTLELDPSQGNPIDSKPPEVGFLAPQLGTFILTSKKGTANFIWQHDLEVDFHSEILKFNKKIQIGESQFYLCTISVETNETGPMQTEVSVLFSVEPAEVGEGSHRIFYKRSGDSSGDSDFNIWSTDAKKFELHLPALGISPD